MEDPMKRDESGRFGAGNAGGTGGIRKMPAHIVDMLKSGDGKAAQVILDCLEAEKAIVVGNGDSAHTEMVPDHPLRLKAAEVLHNRLYGKPVQAITGAEGEPLFPPMALSSLTKEQLAILDQARGILGKGKP